MPIGPTVARPPPDGYRRDVGELARLRHILEEMERVVVAFSGGADSAFLAWVANDTLGPDRVLAATALSASLPGDEEVECRALAAEA